MLKNYNISEILSTEKFASFSCLVDLLEELGTISEFGDLLVDKEYGGKDVFQILFLRNFRVTMQYMIL